MSRAKRHSENQPCRYVTWVLVRCKHRSTSRCISSAPWQQRIWHGKTIKPLELCLIWFISSNNKQQQTTTLVYALNWNGTCMAHETWNDMKWHEIHSSCIPIVVFYMPYITVDRNSPTCGCAKRMMWSNQRWWSTSCNFHLDLLSVTCTPSLSRRDECRISHKHPQNQPCDLFSS